MVNYGLDNKVVLVTGGSRGIGLETARALLAQDAKVVICARKKEGLEKAESELNGGERLLTFAANISKPEEVESLFNAAVERFNGIDALVNNMGMNLMTSSVVDADFSMWQKIIDSNLNSTYLCGAHAARIMKENNRGKIVNLSSIAGSRSAPGMGIYGIAKAAIEMLTKVFAHELASNNIQVNAVAPSMVKTGFSMPFWSDEGIFNEVVKGIPARRIAEIEDVVNAILFLLSEKSDFITGQVINVDGGASAI